MTLAKYYHSVDSRPRDQQMLVALHATVTWRLVNRALERNGFSTNALPSPALARKSIEYYDSYTQGDGVGRSGHRAYVSSNVRVGTPPGTFPEVLDPVVFIPVLRTFPNFPEPLGVTRLSAEDLLGLKGHRWYGRWVGYLVQPDADFDSHWWGAIMQLALHTRKGAKS